MRTGRLSGVWASSSFSLNSAQKQADYIWVPPGGEHAYAYRMDGERLLICRFERSLVADAQYAELTLWTKPARDVPRLRVMRAGQATEYKQVPLRYLTPGSREA